MDKFQPLEESFVFGFIALPGAIVMFLFLLGRSPRSAGFIYAWTIVSLILETSLGVAATVLMYFLARYYQSGGRGELWLLSIPATLSLWLFVGTFPATVAICFVCGRDAQIFSRRVSLSAIILFLCLHSVAVYSLRYSAVPLILTSITGIGLSTFSFLKIRARQ